MLRTLDFLKLVLPGEGLKCVAIFDRHKRVGHRFTTSFEEMAQIIASADALGDTVYHACASYKTSDNRKASNVLAVKSFWLDVDAGAGKPYADAEEAATALLHFTRAAGLPVPVLVGSGNGVHSYWPLREAMAPEDWLRHAHALKHLCDQHGLQADGSRTKDLASILRPPGTRNRKDDTEKLVQWGGPVGPYSLAELGVLNDAPTRVQAVRGVLGREVRGSVPVVRRSLIADALTLHGESPAFAGPIAEQCNQIRAVRDSRGVVAEPHWYAALGVIAHCSDADGIGHEWSSGYPGYSRNETQSRLDRSREFGPTTCEKFAGVNARGCEGCPFKGRITSPIQLGRANLKYEDAAVQRLAGTMGVPEQPREPGILQLLEQPSLPKLPGDFRWHGRSLAFVKETNEGEDLCEVVSTYPLYLKGVQTGEINGDSFSLRFGLELPNEKPKEIILQAKTIFASNGISEISGRGAIIHDSDLFKRYVREAVDMFNSENRLDMKYEQYGWKEDADGKPREFLYGPHLYVQGDAQAVQGADEVKTRNQWLGPAKGGEIGKWSRAANALFTKGCEPQSFALLGSFAAPLMRFHSSGEGGSIISLVNDQSGSGKTTALEAVESVWGRKEAIRLTDDDTRVSKSLILGVLANLPVTWDELYNRDPEKIREFVLMFTNGRDKMRGTQDGGLRHNKAAWQTILMLASNNSIVDILSTNPGSDAPAYRVMEFQTEIPKGIASKGDELKRLLRDNSGVAGDLYMKLLTQQAVLDWVLATLPSITDQIWKKTQLNNEHRFWVRTIASVAAASVVVNKLGILEFSTDRITDWAIEHVTTLARGSENSRRDPIDIFSRFLGENIGAMLAVTGPWKPRTTLPALIEPRRALAIRYEREGQRIYVNENFLRKWLVENSISISVFMRKLKDMNVLVHAGKRVTLGAGTDWASGQSICFEIDGSHPAVSGSLKTVDGLGPRDSQRGARIEKYQAEMDR